MKMRFLVLSLWLSGMAQGAFVSDACVQNIAMASFGFGQVHSDKPNVTSYFEANLPTELKVGVSLVHRISYKNRFPNTSPKPFFTLTPIPNFNQGKIINLNDLTFSQKLPERFVIGDGSGNRALVGVDTTPGSPLSRELLRIKRYIDLKLAGSVYEQQLLEFLRDYVGYQLGPVPNDNGSGIAHLPWDKALTAVPKITMDTSVLQRDHIPVASDYKLPVVPLEHYILWRSIYNKCARPDANTEWWY
jgi:hypothetical protein